MEELRTKSSEQPGTEVLEKAYNAAMALTAAPLPRNNASPHRYTCSTDDGISASFSPTQDQSVLSPKKIPESESSRKMPDSNGVPATIRAPDGTRAVEAEGLIWVDSSQQTAYSVR